MQENSQDQVLEYSISRWKWDITPGVIFFVLIAGIYTFLFYDALYISTSSAETHQDIRDLIKGAIFWTVASIFFWRYAIRSRLDAKRGSIRIRPDGLVIIDWQSKEQELPWSIVTGMRVIHTTRQGVTLKTVWGGSYTPPNWLQDEQPVIDAAIAGAGLVKVKDNWAWASYKRVDAEVARSEED